MATDTIFGTNQNDTLAATQEDQVVLGGNGKDLLTTDFNETTLAGENGDDVLIANNDLHIGATDDDLTFVQWLDGGICNDQLTVTTTADVAGDAFEEDSRAEFVAYAIGGYGHDSISIDMTVTSSSHSYVVAGALVDAGYGNDTVDIDLSVTSEGDDGAVAYVIAGSGADVMNISASASSETGVAASQVLVDAGGGNDSLTAFLTGTETAASVAGGYGNDELVINTVNDNDAATVDYAIVWGDGGNDTIVAAFSSDTVGQAYLDGGTGSDRLSVVGGAGSTLTGGAGSDVLTGSSAADNFYFGGETTDGTANRDTITNYSEAQGDVIELPNGISDVTSWNVVGGNTQLHLTGDGDLIILKNVVVTDLSTDVLFA